MKFIVFGEDWASHPSSTQHLFSELAKQHEVHWINSIGMRKPSAKFHDIKRMLSKLKQLFRQSKTAAIATPNNMTIYKLPVLPWHDNRLIRCFNRWIFSRYLAPLTCSEPIMYWLSVPTAHYLFDKKTTDKLIYYCGDDFSALAGVDAKLVAPFEQQLINSADLIYVISELLLAKMPATKTKMLTHGVSYELFTSDVEKADEIQTIKEPIIGFYGSINAWLDIALLTALVAARPHYQLVLIGDIVTPVTQLLQFKNVTHIGAVSHDRLVSFSAHWDVSILPFVNNEQIRACDPLKLKEYLATGKPIVATDFPAVSNYTPHIFIAHSSHDFINKVDEALSLTQPQLTLLNSVQKNLAKAHSWQAKALIVNEDLLRLNPPH
ncbi:glycosyltransferase [Pseudoalteromonas sp. SG41-2]|uniref:glycosyltransferase n=1 Tax=unclassified Pseudoalteromonas TaxID=194690 RepID=UPI0015FECF4F|nr:MULTISPECIES: glycosyltransferase [unclassified Pseudoalteromonas]MBB1468433.1 glycosyltransferase [Pseudoalteromonas sp. SG41-5]MBB1480706.1 glycosyltransferase [Pseudoalteromonas sp. SG41-2]